MRYLGNKTKLLSFIDSVLSKYDIQGENFMDMFAGTGSVADHMKGRYEVYANDYMKFSSILSEAKVTNARPPKFERFLETYSTNPYEWLNSREYEPGPQRFIHLTYSPAGGRMYFTEENALRIDGIRLDIENLYKDHVLSQAEYSYLIASLMESALKVSNTTGTYQAYLKFWESRALKTFRIEPLEMESSDLASDANQAYCCDTNELARRTSGDIVYLDPPYTATQYANMYHVLETIARYDSPEVFGKTGRRKSRTLSGYSNAHKAIVEFEDLFRQLDYEHVLVSYSSQSIVPLDQLTELASKFAVDGEVHVEKADYREYASNNQSYKDDGQGLKETILYFRKNRSVMKSPLNYSGSKDALVPALTALMPKHVGTFVDAMGGAFNVGANVVAMDKVVYNEYNPRICGIVEMLLEQPRALLIDEVDELIARYGLSKKNKEAYLALRDEYNAHPNPLTLFTLQIYAFQNIIRVNSSSKMNTPVGNNEFNEGTRKRILAFHPKTPLCELRLGRYQDLKPNKFPEDTLFYFDPPYYLSTAEYNDGKRGMDGWNTENEEELLDYLLQVDRSGRKFLLSNVLEHKARFHHLLDEWVREHGFKLHVVGRTGIKYPRTEVAVTNY